MNLNELEIIEIGRVIAHEIHPKTKTSPAFANVNSNLLTTNQEQQRVLGDRLIKALTNGKKTFQLAFENEDENSIFYFLNNEYSPVLSDSRFIEYSQELAENLANSHTRIGIPGGFCIVGEGKTSDNLNFYFIIKAELQEVFKVENNELKLYTEVFLSPAKDFYKIGFFVNYNNSYLPFMYDDQFSLQKKDLTEYFYGLFLGLTTDKNDKLKAKNFWEDTTLFIEDNVKNLHDRLGLLNALKTLYREDVNGTISPREFGENYLTGRIKTDYFRMINEKYPHSFTKDISIMHNRLEIQRVAMKIDSSFAIIGKSEDLERIQVFDNPSDYLKEEFNDGNIYEKIYLQKRKETTDIIDNE